MYEKNSKKRYDYLDICKCLSILAVLVDHLRGHLYNNEIIQIISFYSVSLFIMCSGSSIYYFYINHKKYINILKKISNIIIQYIIASFIYSLFIDRGINLFNLVCRLILFKASGPLYYIFIYIQLIAIFPFLYYVRTSKIVEKNNLLKFLLFIFIFILSILLSNYAIIPDIYAGRLLGGSYLLVFYIGFIFAKRKDEITWKSTNKLLTCYLLIIILYIRFILLNNYYLDIQLDLYASVVNPPGLTLIIYSLTIYIFVYFLEQSNINRYAYINYIHSLFIYIGKNTLYIFLYHRILLDYLLPFLCATINIINPLLKCFIYFLAMILIPIFVGNIINLLLIKLKKYLTSSH